MEEYVVLFFYGYGHQYTILTWACQYSEKNKKTAGIYRLFFYPERKYTRGVFSLCWSAVAGQPQELSGKEIDHTFV